MHHTSGTLSPYEHIRQLQHVYGRLSPAFVAEELHCTLEEATCLLYGLHGDQHCWVSLADLAHLSAMDTAGLKRLVRFPECAFAATGADRTCLQSPG